jgi:hypothetical protein
MKSMIKLSGKTIVLQEAIDIVKKMNGSGKYKFLFSITEEPQQTSTLIIEADDAMHFYMLGIMSQNYIKKLYELAAEEKKQIIPNTQN